MGLKRGVLSARLRVWRFCRNEGCLLPSDRMGDGTAPLRIELPGKSGVATVADVGECPSLHRWAAVGDGQQLEPELKLRTETGEGKEEEGKRGGGMLMGGGGAETFWAGF